MSKIKKLTNAIRNFAECDLDYGTLKTLKMIDDEAERLEAKLKNTSSNNDYAKCKCNDFEMAYRCKKCGSTRLHPIPD